MLGEGWGSLSSAVQPNPGIKVIDATGMYVMPGGIDPHTHLEAAMFNTVSCDDFATLGFLQVADNLFNLLFVYWKVLCRTLSGCWIRFSFFCLALSHSCFTAAFTINAAIPQSSSQLWSQIKDYMQRSGSCIGRWNYNGDRFRLASRAWPTAGLRSVRSKSKEVFDGLCVAHGCHAFWQKGIAHAWLMSYHNLLLDRTAVCWCFVSVGKQIARALCWK